MSLPRTFYIYILSSKSRRIYVGMTNSLFNRVLQHKRGEVEFTSRYKISRLVYYEQFKYVNNCIARETRLKGWSRAKKVALIAGFNPSWEDLAADWGTIINMEELRSRFLATSAPAGENPGPAGGGSTSE